MIKFKRTKKYTRLLTLMVFLIVAVVAFLSMFVNSSDWVILNTAGLSVNSSQDYNSFSSAALVISNASQDTLIMWVEIILLCTLIAFVVGKVLDKHFGKFYCIDCLKKNPHINVRSVR